MRPGDCLLLVVLIVLVVPGTFVAQDTESEPKVVIQFLADRMGMRLKIGSIQPLSQEFIKNYAEKAGSYRLFEVETPDPDQMCVQAKCILEWPNFLDQNHPPHCSDQDCQTILLTFNSDLPLNKKFILKIAGLASGGAARKLPFAVEPSAEITAASKPSEQSDGFLVRSQLPLIATTNVVARNEIFKVERPPSSAANRNPELTAIKSEESWPATVRQPKTKLKARSATEVYEVPYKTEKEFESGQEYNLTIPTGISSSGKVELKTNGTLKIPGAVTAPAESKISGKLSFDTGTRQKAVFDLAGTFTPLHNPNTGSWFWEPSVAVDVGLRSTNSANSIIVSVPATHFFEVGMKEIVDSSRTNISTYAGWHKTPWHRLTDVKMSLGPRAEFDRNFKRINLLGQVRYDFNFDRLYSTIAHQRDLILQEPPNGIGSENGKSLRGIDFGFRLLPFLALDFGGHVNNETVTKTIEIDNNGVVTKQDSTVFVPRHSIFRINSGFVGTFEWQSFFLPVTLTLDESLIYNATTETIGYTTDDGAFLRVIRGVHPHFKTSLDFQLDSLKRYSLSLQFENGRSAPNFQYLNKFTGGIKVTY
jgi:hypothetical protein